MTERVVCARRGELAPWSERPDDGTRCLNVNRAVVGSGRVCPHYWPHGPTPGVPTYDPGHGTCRSAGPCVVELADEIGRQWERRDRIEVHCREATDRDWSRHDHPAPIFRPDEPDPDEREPGLP